MYAYSIRGQLWWYISQRQHHTLQQTKPVLHLHWKPIHCHPAGTRMELVSDSCLQSNIQYFSMNKYYSLILKLDILGLQAVGSKLDPQSTSSDTRLIFPSSEVKITAFTSVPVFYSHLPSRSKCVMGKQRDTAFNYLLFTWEVKIKGGGGTVHSSALLIHYINALTSLCLFVSLECTGLYINWTTITSMHIDQSGGDCANKVIWTL